MEQTNTQGIWNPTIESQRVEDTRDAGRTGNSMAAKDRKGSSTWKRLRISKGDNQLELDQPVASDMEIAKDELGSYQTP